MLPDDTRNKIKDIVRGISIEGSHDTCTAIRNLLCGSFATSTTVKEEFESKSIIKKEQEIFLEKHCNSNNLWVIDFPGESQYLTRGGEARVFLDNDNKSVIKLNDAIYYATWLEFFNSLVLHNLIFINTTYHLLGFVKENNVLNAVLKQPYIKSDNQVDLNDIKRFLTYNEFELFKRNDYRNKELGLILEDMHDENVIVNSDTLFFIDTVFYTVTPSQVAERDI
jgi:hypothetical protein